jgi:hypothetical protein
MNAIDHQRNLQDGRRLGNLTIINPFRPENSRLIDRILPP